MWTTVRRWAGMLLAGALGGFALLFAYWAVGGTWGLEYMWGEGSIPPIAAWLVWITAVCLAAWMMIVLGAIHEWGGPGARRFFRAGCWVIAGTFLLMALGSLKPQEPKRERLIVGPSALVLSLAAVVVAGGGRHVRQTRKMFA